MVSLLFSLALKPVFASVLFLDLNNAPLEIEAVTKSIRVHQPKAQVHVVPPFERFTISLRLQLEENQRQLYQLMTSKMEQCLAAREIFGWTGECDKTYRMIRETEAQREDLIRDFNVKQLEEDLAAIQDSPEVLILSGHHSNGYFGGEFLILKAEELRQIRERNPRLFSRVRTMILLGCKTASIALFRDIWGPVVPSVKLIVGAYATAPLKDAPNNLEFIRALMAKEPLLLAATSSRRIGQLIDSLSGHSWPLAALAFDRFYVTPGRVVDLWETSKLTEFGH